MRIVLDFVLATFLLTFASAEVKVESHRRSSRDPSLDGKVSNEHLIFQGSVSTRLACASACMKHDCGVAFSTSPKDGPSNMMTCRCHDSRSVSQSSTVDAPGSKTHFAEKKPPVKASSWLQRSCWANSDCPSGVPNVVCFHSQCLCQPGYYYSHCRDDCALNCPLQDLQSEALMYYRHFISENNIPGTDVSNCVTKEKGQEACVNTLLCRTFDVSRAYQEDKCYLQAGTALDHPYDFGPHPKVNHYQRTCL